MVVLSNNDGCIVSRSQEAKALGIPMGAPYFQWADFMKAHDVILCSSNFSLYSDLSQRVMQTLETFNPDMEIYSVDEAFLYVGEDPISHCRMIRQKVLQWTGIPVSIGIASTKTLAKIAGEAAKKNHAHKGVFFPSQQELDILLETLHTVDVWGIGRRLATQFAKHGIHTAAQLRALDDLWVKKHFSVITLRTIWELQGKPSVGLEDASSAQSIMTSRSFGRPITTQEELLEAVCTYASMGAEKLREENALASWLQVFTMTGIHHPTSHAHVTLPEPSHYTPILLDYATAALKSIFRSGASYKKAGVLYGGLVPANHYQPDLFIPQDPTTATKRKEAMALVDHINSAYGSDTLHFASSGTLRPWKKKSSLRSPHYTTSWSDLLTISLDIPPK